MNANCRVVVLPAITALLLFTRSSASRSQGASGQAAQSPPQDRKPLEKDEALKPYLPREASLRLPQRYAVRSGIDPSANSHLSKGETEYRAGRSAAAVPKLRQAVKESPDSYDSHYLLALTLTETGQFKEAIDEFKKAIAL